MRDRWQKLGRAANDVALLIYALAMWIVLVAIKDWIGPGPWWMIPGILIGLAVFALLFYGSIKPTLSPAAQEYAKYLIEGVLLWFILIIMLYFVGSWILQVR